MKTLLGFLILVTLLSGCSTKNSGTSDVSRSVQSPAQALEQHGKEKSLEEPFVLVNVLTDDPDNPSPYNPLVKKFGDIPEVRTYMRLSQKLMSGASLTVDEAIALFTAELHLYSWETTRDMLKSAVENKERNERLGFPADSPYLTYTGSSTKDFTKSDNSAAVTGIAPHSYTTTDTDAGGEVPASTDQED